MLSLHRWLCLGLLALATFQISPATASDATHEMATAALVFTASLADDQRARTVLELEPEVLERWHFFPTEMIGGRLGLALSEMNSTQRERALALLNSSLSARGYEKASGVMKLEGILRDLETAGRWDRNPEGYFVTVFGTPDADGTWAWRFEGHHISLVFVVVNGKAFAFTPSFLGSNPAEVRSGPHAGMRVLAAEEDLARELVQSLDADQRKIAIIGEQAPGDILTVARNDIEPLAPAGLGYDRLNTGQQALLQSLVREYVGRVRPDIATEQMEMIERNGWNEVHFAWAGGLEKGQGHYYRVQSPQFLLEYDNTQNDANHVHAVWRDFRNDHGGDLLKQHYQQSHAKGQ